mmetsp:Transcript_44856/g.70244  ORF Transcript_44856/g.70244 Transcript_44856/m.70244 type:complete len:96 (+) Transcript_44856:825-1112(+)
MPRLAVPGVMGSWALRRKRMERLPKQLLTEATLEAGRSRSTSVKIGSATVEEAGGGEDVDEAAAAGAEATDWEKKTGRKHRFRDSSQVFCRQPSS